MKLANDLKSSRIKRYGIAGTVTALALGAVSAIGSLLPISLAVPNIVNAQVGSSQSTIDYSAVPNATSYTIQRATSALGPYTTLANNVTGTEYVDKTATDATQYFYRVIANNGSVTSLPSLPVADILKPVTDALTGSGSTTNTGTGTGTTTNTGTGTGSTGTGTGTGTGTTGTGTTGTGTGTGTGSTNGTNNVQASSYIQGDFNHDGKPDLLLQNTSSLQVAIWYTNSAQVLNGGYVNPSTPAGGTVVGTADFTGNGQPDIVVEDPSSGTVSLWAINTTDSSKVDSSAYLNVKVPAGWKICGMGDFNNNGSIDIVLENLNTNEVALWYTSGFNVTDGIKLTQKLPAGWQIAGAADADGDGNVDLVLQNPSTGQVAFWLMQGSKVVNGVMASVSAGNGKTKSITLPAGWTINAVRVNSANVLTDLVLYNAAPASNASSNVALWMMNGTTVSGGSFASQWLPAGFQIAGPN